MTLQTGSIADRIKLGVLGMALAAPLALAGAAHAQSYPDTNQTLDWTIAFGPGGGNDIIARTIVYILAKYDLYPGDI